MQNIQGILLEPVGCLAEFPAGPFHEIAVRWFGRKGKASKSGSRSYWHLLNLMEAAAKPLEDQDRGLVEVFELEAVDGAMVYEDVLPALAELKTMGIQLCIASSLSSRAVSHFLERCSLSDFFSGMWTRDNAGGIKAAPLSSALQSTSLEPGKTMYLTDTVEGLKVARTAGVNSILMMNDPDEARRLVAHEPSGGIVSLHELPDFIRLVAAEGARARQVKLP